MKEKDLDKAQKIKSTKLSDSESIRQYYQRIIDAMPNNVYWLDRDCMTLGCNKNTLRLIGLKEYEDFVGITYEQMGKLANWTQGQAESFKRDDMDVMKKAQPKYNIEEPPLHDKEGNPTYYLSSRVPLFDEGNNVIGVIGISVDITERKKLEDKLRKTEVSEARFKTLSALGGMIAHELRTPLTGLDASAVAIQHLLPLLIEGYEKSLAKGEIAPIRKDRLKALKQSITHMRRFIKYAENTINTIISGFNYTDPNGQIKTEPFLLNDIVKEALASYPFNIHESHLCTIKSIDTISVLVDKLMIIQVLHNLLKNALHAIHAEKRGHISIWSVRDNNNNKVDLYIEDTAKGIGPEEINHIFEAFYTTKTNSAASIGLGLYFSKMALQRMGCCITCESELGDYTRFKISLPLAI